MDSNSRNIVILASGNGTTFEAIADAIVDGKIQAEISRLICNRKGAGVIDRAKNHGIEYTLTANSGEEMNNEIEKVLGSLSPNLIVLAGFTRILGEDLIVKYKYRIINTHPALLPCFGGMGFYGNRVHKSVLESGAKISGCSVHFVTNEVDGGPIIAQSAVTVTDNDDVESLAQRVHESEKELLVKTISKLLTTEYDIIGKRVLFR